MPLIVSMTPAVLVFGLVIAALSALITAALDHRSIARKVATFAAIMLLLTGLSGLGAMMGVIIREAIKALP